MAELKYNSENKRIATADSSGVAHIPEEDTENERISLYSGSTNPKNEFILDSEGYYTVKGKIFTEEYIDPATLGLVPDSDGYIKVGA